MGTVHKRTVLRTGSLVIVGIFIDRDPPPLLAGFKRQPLEKSAIAGSFLATLKSTTV